MEVPHSSLRDVLVLPFEIKYCLTTLRVEKIPLITFLLFISCRIYKCVFGANYVLDLKIFKNRGC